MGCYRKKALMEALLRRVEPPMRLRGYFRVIREVYAHDRNDLALSLCRALVPVAYAIRDEGPPGLQASDDAALEAILTALAACRLFPRGRSALPTTVFLG